MPRGVRCCVLFAFSPSPPHDRGLHGPSSEAGGASTENLPQSLYSDPLLELFCQFRVGTEPASQEPLCSDLGFTLQAARPKSIWAGCDLGCRMH